MQGKNINGFELKRLLGVGGMAEVWYAENEIHKAAAVKVLNPDLSLNASIVERFRNEAEIMVRLDHRNIRQVYGYGLIDGRPAIIMEYLEGDDLKTRMKKSQRFSDAQLIKWWNQLVEALNYTHSKGIIHRDIKPGNIFVDVNDNIKLLDFGISKVREGISSTQTGQKLGTLMYMSPEQVKDSKHIDYHTDIYSLAVTFVHLVTGKKPYDSDTSSDFEIQLSIVTKSLDLSEVPSRWRNFLEPYLNKEADQRPELCPFEEKTAPVYAAPDKDEATIVDEVKEEVKPLEEKPVSKPKPQAEPKKALFEFDKKVLQKKFFIWLGLFALYIIILLLSELLIPSLFTTKVMEGGIFWFVVFVMSVWLCKKIIKTLDNKIKHMPWILVCAMVLLIISAYMSEILLQYDIWRFFKVYVFYMVALISLSAWFVYRPAKYKWMPYLVAFLMIIVFASMTHYRVLLYFNDEGCLYYNVLDKISKAPNLYSVFLYSLEEFVMLPTISFIVMMIVRAIKAKKAVKAA